MRFWIALIVVSMLAGCDAKVSKDPNGGIVIETSTMNVVVEEASPPAPTEVKLVLKSYDELQALIASKKGKVVIVDAWSTYCPPCMEAFPGLVALHKKYGADKLACISLCTNYSGLGKPEDEIEGPLEFLKQQGATFDNLLSTDADEALYKKLKIPSVPCIFVYDQEGKNVKTFTTETKYSVVEEVVKPLLK